MWAQRLQRSKPLIIALVVMMLVFSFQASRPQAVGLDTAVKIVAGSNAQKLVRSIGEKAGMAFTPKSLQATTDYINGQAAKGNAKYVDLAKKVNAAGTTGVPDSTKPGWKKYLLDPVLWLTGADLLVEAYDAFNDAQQSGTQVPMYGSYPGGGGSCLPVDVSDTAKDIYLKHMGTVSQSKVATISKVDFGSCVVTGTARVYGNTLRVSADVKKKDGSKTTYAADFEVDDYTKYNGSDYEYTRVSSDDDEFDISNVTNADTYRTTIDSDDDYTKVTYDNDIEIYAPDETNTTVTNNYTTPWNTKMPDDEFTLIVQPIQDVDIVIPPDDDDDLPTGPRPDPVETLDRSLLQVAKESYGYFDDAIDSSVASMRSVADGAGGIVDFLDDSMDWLPAEWRAVFTATFMLGVFAHFFRR